VTTGKPISAAYGVIAERETHVLTAGCRCGARWSGLSTAHCGSCHVTFTSVTAFDRHRRGGRCLDPVEAGLEAKTRPGGYVAYGRVDDGRHPEWHPVEDRP
jgi:hypothetical protein